MKCVNQREQAYRGRKYKEGEKDYEQLKIPSKWSGPYIIINHYNGSICLHSNGNIAKVAEYAVQPIDIDLTIENTMESSKH